MCALVGVRGGSPEEEDEEDAAEENEWAASGVNARIGDGGERKSTCSCEGLGRGETVRTLESAAFVGVAEELCPRR